MEGSAFDQSDRQYEGRFGDRLASDPAADGMGSPAQE
jgi:hypothetical protein